VFESKNPERDEIYERHDENEAPCGGVSGALEEFGERDENDSYPEEPEKRETPRRWDN
jgi:hypothetical protein